jgi:hypothetical protein
MTEFTTIPESTSATLEERAARLRTELRSSQQGQKTMIKLLPSEMVHTNPGTVDFCDWQEWTRHW